MGATRGRLLNYVLTIIQKKKDENWCFLVCKKKEKKHSEDPGKGRKGMGERKGKELEILC